LREKVIKKIRDLIVNCEPHKDVFLIRPLKKILKKELSLAEDLPEDVEEIIKDFLEEVMDSFNNSRLRSKSIIRELFMECIESAKSVGVDPGELSRELLYLSLQDSESDRKRPVQKKTKDKRNRILSAALKVISENGYEAATIEMIAKSAGVSKGSVYRYYDSKENLVTELINHMFDKFADKINDRIHEDLEALDIIQVHVQSYLEFIEENKEFYNMILNARNVMGPAARAEYYTRILEHVPLMKHKIIEAAQQGNIKFTSFFTIYYGVMGYLDGVIHRWLRSNCSYSLVNEVPVILENLFYGLVTEEHAKKHRKGYMELANSSISSTTKPIQVKKTTGKKKSAKKNPARKKKTKTKK
jgi:AcrR family transcriptional regulator